MKIAIASEGNTLKSQIDSRFGRCNYFAFYDTDTNQVEFLNNPGKEASGGAGPATVQFVAQHGVKRVVAREFGGKTVLLLQNLGIEMVTQSDKTIEEIISEVNANK